MAKKKFKCNCGKTTTYTGKDAIKIVSPKKNKNNTYPPTRKSSVF